jgi:hypothetical protein
MTAEPSQEFVRKHVWKVEGRCKAMSPGGLTHMGKSESTTVALAFFT